MLLTIYSPIAQLVERLTVNQNVTGSSPVWGAKYRSVVQSGRTLALGARGRKFESCRFDHHWGISSVGRAQRLQR